MEERQNLEQVIDSDFRIAVVDTSEPDQLLAHFKRLSLTTGRAVYDWSAEHGLYRLGIEHIFIPRTRTPGDVLAYITSSRHFGIYLLRDFGGALDKPTVERQLAKFLEKQDGIRRLIVLFGTDVRVPASAAAHTVYLRYASAAPRSASA